MSGWAIATIRTLYNHEYQDLSEVDSDDYVDPQKEVAREVLRHDFDEVGVGTNRTVYIYGLYPPNTHVGGLPDVISETADYWDKVVFLTANDTGDTGSAELWEQTEDGIEKTDEFSEYQYEDGSFVGRVAAAYMMYEHHVDALADYYDKPYWRASTPEEVDELY